MNNDLNARDSIRDTFIDLYKNKNITNIRITDLTQRAGISRGTFYLHYEDIYDLRREIEDELLGLLKVLVSKEKPKNIFIMNIEELAKYFTPVLDLVYKNKRYIASLLSNGSDDYFENNMKQIMSDNITRGINGMEKFENNYIIDYMVSANMAVIKKWIKDDKEIESKEIALLISNFTMKGPIGFIK